jgi:hypothetical protein
VVPLPLVAVMLDVMKRKVVVLPFLKMVFVKNSHLV